MDEMDIAAEERMPEEADQEPTAEQRELFELAVGRTLEALAQDPDGLDSALKADPVSGAVNYGTKALHVIAESAEEAGSPLPLEVLIGAGMQVIKVIGGIAEQKGYLAEEAMETYLKEAFQRSLAKWTQMDMQAGKIDRETMTQVQRVMGGPPEPSAPSGPGALAAAGGA